MNYGELFVWMLMGHLIGDYWFQNEWMALNKSRRNKYGWAACSIHVTLYTGVVMAFIIFGSVLMGHWWAPDELAIWFAGISVPHYLIDHYSIFSKFMAWKNGKHPFELLKDKSLGCTVPNAVRVMCNVEGEQAIYGVAFAAPVYIITDNISHLLMLWLMVRFML